MISALQKSELLNPILHCLGLFTTGSDIRGHASLKGKVCEAV